MTASTPRRGPLSRFRVIDLTRVRSGPTAVRQLADWGADVIKIETPPGLNLSDGWGGKRTGADFQNLHRNKRGFTLNLKEARREVRCGGRELPPRREVPSRYRL
jgi:crotonobetainyl-CoA:carnitine CoA-transferase CaiB-like acyl-CoA transferase